MKKFSYLFLFLTFFVFSALTTFAVEFQSDENVSITGEKSDDLYVLAGNTIIQSNVNGDLYILGGNVTVNGNVSEDLVILGARVTVNGNVGGDMRLLGGQLAVFGNVGDDIVVGGGQVDITKSSTVSGSVVSTSGILTIEGTVKEDLRGNLGLLILNGSVERDVIVVVEDDMEIAQSASIGRNLEYSSLIESTIPAGVVKGKASYNEFEKETVRDLSYLLLAEKIVNYVSALILGVLLVLMMPRGLIKSAEIAKSNVFKSFVLGLFSVIGVFIGGIVLMFSIVGIPLAMMLFAALLVSVYLAKIFVAVWLGSYFFNYKKYAHRSQLLGILVLMLVAYFLIGMIPKVGLIIVAVLFFIGIGSLVQMKMEFYNCLRGKKMI